MSGGSGKVLAAENHLIWGSQVQISNDFGQTWGSSSQPPRFSGGGSATVERIWHIEPAGDSEPGTLYAGVQPAALFKSRDGGETWEEVAGLSNHPTREHWEPGRAASACTASLPTGAGLDGCGWAFLRA